MRIDKRLKDKTGGLRPDKGGLYSFNIKYSNGVEETRTSVHKLDYRKYLTEDVVSIIVDLL